MPLFRQQKTTSQGKDQMPEGQAVNPDLRAHDDRSRQPPAHYNPISDDESAIDSPDSSSVTDQQTGDTLSRN